MQERPAKPNVDWLQQTTWNACCDLNRMVPAFRGLTTDIVKTPVWVKVGDAEIRINPAEWTGYDKKVAAYVESHEEPKDDGKVKGHWDERLSIFQKLMIVKAFVDQKVGVSAGRQRTEGELVWVSLAGRPVGDGLRVPEPGQEVHRAAGLGPAPAVR